MNYTRIRDIKAKSEGLVSRMCLLEEMHKETMEKINETQNICNHEFIFINKKYGNKAYEYLQYGKCLICGKGITLKPNNFEVDERIFIPSEKIIDVSGEIEFWDVLSDCSESKSEIEEAQRVFDKLLNESNYSRDCIKSAIVDAVNEARIYNKFYQKKK